MFRSLNYKELHGDQKQKTNLRNFKNLNISYKYELQAKASQRREVR